ncbi:anaphase-promoting complex subunit cdc27 [Dissophora globulifera]|nr:anaphase-promoting complex subunit cdc27 [Dissophora globulifera]
MAVPAGFTAEGTGSAMTTNQSTVPKLEPVSQRLEHIIKYSLDKFEFRTAVFLAERLLYEARSDEYAQSEQEEYARYLLAMCHYRQGDPEIAWAVLERSTSPRSRFLFARCCLEVRRYVEGNSVLEGLLKDTNLVNCPTTDVMTSAGVSNIGEPDRASVLNLLGHTARAQHRHKVAVKYYKEAVELNPFLWEAFENLCELGSPMNPNHMFAQFDTKITSTNQRTKYGFQRSRTTNLDASIFLNPMSERLLDDNVESASADSSNILNNTFLRHEPMKSKTTFLPSLTSNSIPALSRENGPSLADPGSNSMENNPPLTVGNRAADTTERVPLRRGAATHARRQFERAKSSTSLAASGGVTKRALERATSVTRGVSVSQLRGLSTRDHAGISANLGSKKNATSADERDQPAESSGVLLPLMTAEDVRIDEDALRTVASIFHIMAKAYGLLALNNSSGALAEFERLPRKHFESGWIQCQVAKCKSEMLDYLSASALLAAKYFERARKLEPTLQRDMEVYSTCLWQLRKEMALSTLAKELKDANIHSPQAWVALGNAYSLKHDSDQALKCFQRAIQLDDGFAYAHTLSGHEYTELEEYDKAQTEFRTAMSIDPRHYHAWYGMSMIYSKMGKNDLALIHAKEAHRLNSSNSVLLYHVGLIQERMSRTTEALRSFEQTIALDPSNAAARFRKANVQMNMEQYEDALNELETIKTLSPDEANVFVLQGRILAKMGDKGQALRYFTWALNLDSKSSHTIRDLIDKLGHD